jgi:hypothetical protein
MTAIKISFIYLCLLASGFGTSVPPEEGKYGLQDLPNTAEKPLKLLVGEHTHVLQDLHQDLIKLEKQAKGLDGAREQTNLVFAKIGFYKSDGSSYFVPLHQIIDLAKPLLFDSATSLEDTRKNAGDRFSFIEERPDLPVIETSHPLNVAPRGGVSDQLFSGTLPLESVLKKVRGVKQDIDIAETDIDQQIVTRKSLLQQTKSPIDDSLKAIEEDLAKKLEALSKLRPKYREELTKVIGTLWHSETRLLRWLNLSSHFSGFLTGVAVTRTPSTPILLVGLHLHSTKNVCDSCRLQLTGASYNWLYKKMVDKFCMESTHPKFHILVSWEKPHDVFFDNKKDQEILDISRDIGSRKDLDDRFTSLTPPLLSLFQLFKT